MADTLSDANGGSVLDTTKANAAAAYNSVTSGPVAQNVKENTAKASNELSNLAASRRTPEASAATGQSLTHYHSFFYELLSWNNPRASAIALVSIVSLIFFTRIDIARHALRLTWMALGTTILAESLGKFVFNSGLATQLRPRRYYTVSRETIDSLVGDVHELVNFIVIEAQRVLFVESIPASIITAIFAFTFYHLTKVVPYWGLAIIGTITAFVVPLLYVSNKELIDHHLKNASDTIEAQTSQVRDVAHKQVEQVTTIGKQYAGDYGHKVQELVRGHKDAAPQKQPEFPTAPTEEPTKPVPEIQVPSAPDVPEEPVGSLRDPPLAS